MRKRLFVTIGVYILCVGLTACTNRGNTNNVNAIVPSVPPPQSDESNLPTDGETTVTVGEVKLVSAGVQYEPLENWIYSAKDGLAADGWRKQPEDMANELETILISDDVQILIEGKTTSLQSYTLYDETYEVVYYRQDKFEPPDESGRYILCVEAAWGTEDQYSGYQYFFMIEK